MRIVHVETGRHLYGGPQQVLYLTAGLAAQGVDNLLVCAPDSAIAAAAREQGTRVIELRCRGDLDLRFAWRLRQVLADERPDLVHCHSRRGADIMGGQAASMLGIPAVVSRRVDNPEPTFLSALRYRRFRRVVAISDAIARVLLDAGLDPAKLTVIHSSVDVGRFAVAPERGYFEQEFGLPAGSQVIVSAGQFIHRKGQRHLLSAVATLTERFPRMRVLLFGQGPLEAELRRICESGHLDEIVTFLGFRDDLDDWLGAADLLVHTALAEGLGVIALKAQAAGVPVVAFAAGGVPEVVEDAGTGLLVPPADDRALADAIATLLDDSELRGRYATAARARAREQFAIEPMVTAHLRLYESILNG